MSEKFLANGEFNRRLEQPLQLYEQGLSIWNRAGLNYDALVTEARDLSIEILNNSLESFNSLKHEDLTRTQVNFVEAYIQLVQAQILYIRSSSEGMTTLEQLQKKYSLLGECITTKEKAFTLFEVTGVADETFLRGLKFSILIDKAVAHMLTARIQSRIGNVDATIDSYKQSEEAYLILLKLFEDETPELTKIKEKILSRTTAKYKVEDEENIDQIGWVGNVLTLDDDFGNPDNLDIYRRTWANYYSAKGSRNIIEAQALIWKLGSQKLIVEKIDTSIACIYSGMEFFPDQLDFHQDLFDAYHMKGVLFGCPIPQRANYYYLNCPLAIMRLVGHWYLSAGIRYRAMVCSVCGRDILECPHIPGQNIDGVTVECRKEGISLKEISMVDVPRDPQCRLNEIRIPVKVFDSIIPKDISPSDDRQLTCHLCNVEPSELTQFPILIQLPPEIVDTMRRNYMKILKMDMTQE